MDEVAPKSSIRQLHSIDRYQELARPEQLVTVRACWDQITAISVAGDPAGRGKLAVAVLEWAEMEEHRRF